MNSAYSIQANSPRLNDSFFPELSQFFGKDQPPCNRSEIISSIPEPSQFFDKDPPPSNQSEILSSVPEPSQFLDRDLSSPKSTKAKKLFENMKKIFEKKWYYAPNESHLKEDQKTIYALFDKNNSHELTPLRNFLRRKKTDYSPGPFKRPSLVSKPPILFVPKFLILSIVAQYPNDLNLASLVLSSPSGNLKKIEALYFGALKTQSKKDKNTIKMNIIKFHINKTNQK